MNVYHSKLPQESNVAQQNFPKPKQQGPQDLLCTSQILHQMKDWVLKCKTLEEVAQANGLTAAMPPQDACEESYDRKSLRYLAPRAQRGGYDGGFLKLNFEENLASKLRAAIKDGASTSEQRHLTVCRLRLSSLPVHLIKRAASEAMCRHLSPEVGSEDGREPYDFQELAESYHGSEKVLCHVEQHYTSSSQFVLGT
jgi:hypothetical protein